MVDNYYFPHIILQEFWAAIHIKVAKINTSDFGHHIFLHPNILYFVCGMYSSDSTMLHSIFDMVFQIEDRYARLLFDFTTCGSESGLSSQSLADIYLKLHGPILKLYHLLPYSPRYVKVQSFLDVIHYNITQISFTQHCTSSLRLYINRTGVFPNLNTVNITVLFPKPGQVVKCPVENTRLMFNLSRRISELILLVPMQALLDEEFLNYFNKTVDSVAGKMCLQVVYLNLHVAVPFHIGKKTN